MMNKSTDWKIETYTKEVGDSPENQCELGDWFESDPSELDFNLLNGDSHNENDEINFEQKKKTQQYKLQKKQQQQRQQEQRQQQQQQQQQQNVFNEEKTSSSRYRSPNKLESRVSKIFFRSYDLNYDLNFK